MIPEQPIHRHRPPAEIERAHQHWRRSGGLRRTAAALGIPEGTVITWSRQHDWVQRRRDEEAADAEIVRDHATILLVEDAHDMVRDLLALTRSADRDQVRLNAVKHALAILGIVPAHLAGRFDPIRLPSLGRSLARDDRRTEP